jgi:hypothetical protein
LKKIEKINYDTEDCGCDPISSIFGIEDWSVTTLGSPHY